MDENELKNNITKEIRILADAPPDKNLIPKYEEALEYLRDVPEVPESTQLLDKEAIKAITEERNLDKARTCEEKIEMRRKMALREKIRHNLTAARNY